MMKKIMPFAIVIGVVSLVACTALGSCDLEGTRVFEAAAGFVASPKRVNESNDPILAGVFDTFDYDDSTAQFCTLGYHFTDASLVSWFSDQGTSIRYLIPFDTHASQSWNGSTYDRGIGVISCRLSHDGRYISTTQLPTFSGNAFGVWVNGLSGAYVEGFCIDVSKQLLSSYDRNGLQDFFDTYDPKLQYATTQLLEVPLDSYNDYPRWFAPDYADVAINIHVDSSSPLYNPSIGVELYYDVQSSQPDEFIVMGEVYTIKRRFFKIPDDYFEFQLFADDLYLDFEVETYLGGNHNPLYPVGYSYDERCYLPYFEGEIDIYVNVHGQVGNTQRNNRSAYFAIDTSDPNHVNCGGAWANAYYDGYDDGTDMADIYAQDARSEGYSEGYDSGRSVGNSEGYDSGRSEGYNEGAQSGYSQGYSAGHLAGEQAVQDAGEAVNNLFGAIVNIPVNVLNGLSGFTIWSVPLLSIIFTFLFLGIVIWIVRKFI